MGDSATTCDEIMSFLMEIPCFTCFLINYHCIIDNFQYLLLSDKILSKTKTFVTVSQHKRQVETSFILIISIGNE